VACTNHSWYVDSRSTVGGVLTPKNTLACTFPTTSTLQKYRRLSSPGVVVVPSSAAAVAAVAARARACRNVVLVVVVVGKGGGGGCGNVMTLSLTNVGTTLSVQ
jgi:hypothetical protein